MNVSLFVKKIQQIDNHRFSIEWSDRTSQIFRLCDLQRQCPCAQCTEETAGKQLPSLKNIPENLKAFFIRNVGRYALRIQFSSGCSAGIYSFTYLRKMGKDCHV